MFAISCGGKIRQGRLPKVNIAFATRRIVPFSAMKTAAHPPQILPKERAR
jgi:hypothetical protein